MSSIASSSAGSLGTPLYQRKTFSSPATEDIKAKIVPDVNAGKQNAAAAQSAASPPPSRAQTLTKQLDDKLNSSLSSVRQKIGGSGSASAGRVLDVKA